MPYDTAHRVNARDDAWRFRFSQWEERMTLPRFSLEDAGVHEDSTACPTNLGQGKTTHYML